MRHPFRLAWMLAICSLLCSDAPAQGPFVWENRFGSRAGNGGANEPLGADPFLVSRLHTCKQMDAEVFAQPEVARQVQANYVPVKINADQYQELAKNFGVNRLPMDVVLAPQGQIVNVARAELMQLPISDA